MAQPSHPSSSLVDFIPLMRSPATWTPQPVLLPPDIHPLPDDISAYFVYPYTLEDFVLNPQPPHVSHAERIRKLHEAHDERVKFLREREEEKTRRRKEALRKLAPGYEPPEDVDNDTLGEASGSGSGGFQGGDGQFGNGSGSNALSPGLGNQEGKRRSGILEPTRKPTFSHPRVNMSDKTLDTSSTTNGDGTLETKPPESRDVMDDLVEGLAHMDELSNQKH